MTVVRGIAFALLFFSSSLYGQDTLRITLRQADSLLITRNLALIASRYDIDVAEAARTHARLFSNPEISTEWNLYNPSKQRWADIGPTGQRIISLQKVFQIAGQRGTSMKLADESKRMTEFEYEELVRTLRYELHATFSRYHFLNRAVNTIDSQLKLLSNLIRVYGEQYNKGNISLQELARLKTTHFNINKQIKDVQQEQIRLQATLKVLLSEDGFVLPEDPGTISYPLSGITMDALVDRAMSARPEIRISSSQRQQEHLRYALAKKEAIPDLTAGVLFDQSGSYVSNYTAVTLGLQVPIFNRNQGQIQAARTKMAKSEALQLATEARIRNEVESAWRTFQLLWNQYREVGEDHEEQLNQLSEGLVNNYSKNNISLLEFTDRFEAYNTNIIQFNQLKADLNQSYEELSYAVGENLSN